MKIADFGFATFTKITDLQTQKATITYMAPEFRKGLTYDGTQTDLFAAAVILFTVILGHFPFKSSSKNDKYYNLVYTNKPEDYWEAFQGQDLSQELKDLLFSMFAYNGEDRPNIEEVLNSKWIVGAQDMDVVKIKE